MSTVAGRQWRCRRLQRVQATTGRPSRFRVVRQRPGRRSRNAHRHRCQRRLKPTSTSTFASEAAGIGAIADRTGDATNGVTKSRLVDNFGQHDPCSHRSRLRSKANVTEVANGRCCRSNETLQSTTGASDTALNSAYLERRELHRRHGRRRRSDIMARLTWLTMRQRGCGQHGHVHLRRDHQPRVTTSSDVTDDGTTLAMTRTVRST